MKNILEQIKQKKGRLALLLSCFCLFGLMSCEEFLDAKPNQSLVVPKTLADVQSLLDNTNVFNGQATLPSIATEEVWISDAGYASLSNPIEQAVYIWSDDPYPSGFSGDWNGLYEQVFYANVALEVLEDFEGEKPELYNVLLGSAYFYRGYAYLQLVSEFAIPYQKAGGNESMLGIVLKSTADVNEELERANLQESYDQIYSDLNRAVELLPSTNAPKTRPTKAIALGVLSRVYLNTFQYELAAKSSIEALGIYTDRLDFNNIDVEARRPFTRFDEETIFYSTLFSYSYLRSTQVFVDSALIDLFEENDLRKPAFFDETSSGNFNYTGKLSGATQNFGGISVGELYLNAAEALVRTGEDDQALSMLNDLLSLRYQSDSWVPLAELNLEEVLERILQERRKELIGRGLRWMDLRRLNQEGETETLVREVNGIRYELAPNSPRYAFPIPLDEISRSGIIQNP